MPGTGFSSLSYPTRVTRGVGVDVVSTSLRNYKYNAVWGFLVDQSWIG